MPDQHSDDRPASSAAGEPPTPPEATAPAPAPSNTPAPTPSNTPDRAPEDPTPPRHRPRRDWRQGGHAVRRWDLTVLSVALVGLGLGVVAGGAVNRIAAPWAPFASSVVLWVGMLAAIVFALARSRPARLLRFKPTDLLWGIAFGLALRLLQGWITGGGSFPSAGALGGGLPSSWWLTDALPAMGIAPLIEEFFFRGILLVVVYQLFRRSLGGLSAGLTALLVSTGGFVLLHAASGSLTLRDAIVLFAVGATCSLVVLLTGRIWGAVLTHAVYNAAYVVLIVAGTALA